MVNLLFSRILSKLSLTYSIRCSMLSSDLCWYFKFLTHFKISNSCFKEELIDHKMLFHAAPPESFELSLTNSYGIDNNINGKLVWKWLCFLSSKRVKEITLLIF